MPTSSPLIRPLQLSDNLAIAQVIRTVSHEYGLSPDRGFSVADPTLDRLYQVYQQANAAYWVIELGGDVVGGAGIAPLAGEPNLCELQKMYLLPSARQQGLAKQLMQLCLTTAKQLGFTECYLETTAELKEAINLYHQFGFDYLDAPRGSTGHDACEVVMLKTL